MSNFWLNDKTNIYNSVIVDVAMMDLEIMFNTTIEQMLDTNKGDVRVW